MIFLLVICILSWPILPNFLPYIWISFLLFIPCTFQLDASNYFRHFLDICSKKLAEAYKRL